VSDVGERERKKTETRAALRDAALVSFATHGFSQTRIADVAAACGVSERTFFRYFDSKEQVAVAGMEAWLEQLFVAIESLPDSYDPIEAVTAVIRQAEAGRFAFGMEEIRDAVAYATFPEVQDYFARVTDKFRQRLAADFARRSGTDVYDPYPRVLASIISAGMFAIIESWLRGGRGGNPWRMAREAIARVASEFAASDLNASWAPKPSDVPAPEGRMAP
jgi:AcrR family transcriptional regulator